MSRSVRVKISGYPLSVVTDAKPRYVRDLAAEVERRIELARGGGGRTASTQSLALMAAMSLVDELTQLRDDQRRLKREIRERSQRILQVLEREAQA